MVKITEIHYGQVERRQTRKGGGEIHRKSIFRPPGPSRRITTRRDRSMRFRCESTSRAESAASSIKKNNDSAVSAQQPQAQAQPEEKRNSRTRKVFDLKNLLERLIRPVRRFAVQLFDVWIAADAGRKPNQPERILAALAASAANWPEMKLRTCVVAAAGYQQTANRNDGQTRHNEPRPWRNR